MKALVTVSPKRTVLDPQGMAIQRALNGRGYGMVDSVRQGKVFEIQLRPETNRADAQLQLEEIARDILANPVIEDFRVDLVD